MKKIICILLCFNLLGCEKKMIEEESKLSKKVCRIDETLTIEETIMDELNSTTAYVGRYFQGDLKIIYLRVGELEIGKSYVFTWEDEFELPNSIYDELINQKSWETGKLFYDALINGHVKSFVEATEDDLGMSVMNLTCQ